MPAPWPGDCPGPKPGQGQALLRRSTRLIAHPLVLLPSDSLPHHPRPEQKATPTSQPTNKAWQQGDPCPVLPPLDQIPDYGYVSMGSTSKAENLCESPFYFPYKCTGWFTAAQEAKYKLAEPAVAVAEHFIEWQDDAAGTLYKALTNDLASELAGNAIVKFVDAFAFKAECIVINKHRKGSPLQCKKQCEEPSNWGTNQVAYFSKYQRGKKIRLNFYIRSNINTVAITTAGGISSVSGFKNALTYVFSNQATGLQAAAYEAALQFAPQSSEFVNVLAGYPATKPTCRYDCLLFSPLPSCPVMSRPGLYPPHPSPPPSLSPSLHLSISPSPLSEHSFFDIFCHIIGAPAPKKSASTKFKIVGAGTTDVLDGKP